MVGGHGQLEDGRKKRNPFPKADSRKGFWVKWGISRRVRLNTQLLEGLKKNLEKFKKFLLTADFIHVTKIKIQKKEHAWVSF